MPRVHFVDEVTPNTFLSGKLDEKGKKRKQPASLLHRIGSDGIMIAADFSTFTSNPKTLAIVLSQLRRIYDGNLSREFGSEENLEERTWKGRLTVFAGAVPDVDRHWSLFQELGERFVRVRWPRAGGVETALMAMDQTDEAKREVRQALRALVLPILTHQLRPPVLDRTTQVKLANLSEFATMCRTFVRRDGYKREATEMPVTEGNTRLPQQLCQIARGSALLDGRSHVNADDYQLVCRVAFDSMPPPRLAILKAITCGRPLSSSGLSNGAVDRALEDLRLGKVLTSKNEISADAGKFMAEAGLGELSPFFTGRP